MRFDAPLNSANTPSPAEKPKAKRKMRFPRPKLRLGANAIIILACSLVILALAGLSGFLYWQNNNLKNNPVSSEDTADSVIEKISKVYALPKGERPTVATVKNVNELKGQPFFKDAQNGDAVLVFAKAKFAILYREKNNQVINTGPVYTEEEKQNAGASTDGGDSATETLKAEQ